MTEAWRKRKASGRPDHGLGTSDYLPGNVQHLISPIVGHLRLMQRAGELTFTPEYFEHIIDRLMFVIEIAREADEKEQMQ